MTVRELIKVLKSWPNKDTQIIVSSDAEGNSFGVLDEVVEALVNEDGDLIDGPDDDEEELSGTRAVLVIYPV